MDEELNGYLDAAVKDKMRSGMSQEDALRAARVEMGSVDAVKEEIRSAGWESTLETIWQDIRYGLRMLAKNPGFTAVAVVMLGLGTGAGAAIFSILYAVAIRPLPYLNPEQLVEIWRIEPQIRWSPASGPDFLDWANQSDAFSGLAADGYYEPTLLTENGQAEHLDGFQVTPDFFKVLRAHPAKGRFFVKGDDESGHDHVAVLGEGFLTRALGKDLSAIGSMITLDNEQFEVIGTVPDSFRFPVLMPGMNPMPDVFVPIPHAQLSKDRAKTALYVIGRLRSGATIRQAQTQMTTIATRLAQQYPESDKGMGIEVKPLEGLVRTGFGVVIGSVLLFGVGFLLLLACANVAILMLTRGARRRHEIAIRQAVGGSRARVTTQLLTESMLVALAGGAVGILLASWFRDGLLALDPDHLIPAAAPIEMNFHVLAFTLGVSIATGVLFGLGPALQLCRVNLQELLNEGAHATRSGARSLGHRDRLVVLEVTLALSLLIACGLMIRTLAGTLIRPQGFNPHNMLSASLALADSKYPTPEVRNAFSRDLIERVKALPGVQSAALEGRSPSHVAASGNGVTPSSFKLSPLAQISMVSSNYFRTIQLPLLRGRQLTWADYTPNPAVAIISSTMARDLWPNQDALGKRFTPSYPPEWYEVVGIAGDNIRPGAPTMPEAYLPKLPTRVSLLVRTEGDPKAVIPALRDLIKNADKDAQVGSIQTMEKSLAQTGAPVRNLTIMLCSMTIIVLLLATVGVYAVVAYAVAQRTHEIGVRMALGARREQVLFLVMRDGIRLSLIGVVTGLALAIAVGRILASFLFGVTFGAISTYFAVSMLLLAVTVLASYIPARRATKVDPMVALRYE
jgi:putative ABC transport system permease protein